MYYEFSYVWQALVSEKWKHSKTTGSGSLKTWQAPNQKSKSISSACLFNLQPSTLLIWNINFNLVSLVWSNHLAFMPIRISRSSTSTKIPKFAHQGRRTSIVSFGAIILEVQIIVQITSRTYDHRLITNIVGAEQKNGIICRTWTLLKKSG